MANKEALRELQTRLARRLQGAREQADTAASWLAVECAGQGFLLPLAQAGEIFPWAPVVPVPHSRDWFLGVANLRGRLHGVIDLAAFFGLRPADPVRDPVRMIAFNPALGMNAALLVERLAGLRSQEQLRLHEDGDVRPAFAGTRYADAQGRIWHELQLATLAEDEMFLRIAH